jgi:putative oxidoreductase
MASKPSLLRADFLPSSTDLALLLLRVWLGASLLWLHGLGKIPRLMADEVRFASVAGLSPTVSLALAVVGEVVAPVLLIVGLGTRWAALLSAATMLGAFVVGHGMALSGERSGELPFMLLAGFLAIVVAGPGRFSLDGRSSK